MPRVRSRAAAPRPGIGWSIVRKQSDVGRQSLPRGGPLGPRRPTRQCVERGGQPPEQGQRRRRVQRLIDQLLVELAWRFPPLPLLSLPRRGRRFSDSKSARRPPTICAAHGPLDVDRRPAAVPLGPVGLEVVVADPRPHRTGRPIVDHEFQQPAQRRSAGQRSSVGPLS